MKNSVVSRISAIAIPELEGAVDTAHGKTKHVKHIQGTQHAEVGPSIFFPLEVHQLLYRGLFQDLTCLPGKKSVAWCVTNLIRGDTRSCPLALCLVQNP